MEIAVACEVGSEAVPSERVEVGQGRGERLGGAENGAEKVREFLANFDWIWLILIKSKATLSEF